MAGAALIALSASVEFAWAVPRGDRLAGNRALTVLYDQTGDDSGFATISYASGNAFVSQAADDFSVPDGGIWTVKEVDADGMYFNGYGPAETVYVVFYEDRHGKPGKAVASLAVSPSADHLGSFVLPLGNGVTLGGGQYWLSVAADLGFGGGLWAWENQSRGTKEGDRAMYRDPNQCPRWRTEKKCLQSKLGDHLFVLKGMAQ
jgi:hypothetical protein